MIILATAATAVFVAPMVFERVAPSLPSGLTDSHTKMNLGVVGVSVGAGFLANKFL